MIRELQLNNIKAHKDTHLRLGNLTFLCGKNGAGKSSIIQSLLLLRQTYQKHILTEGLDLNKPLCEIGTAQDLFYQYAQEDFLSIQLTFDNLERQAWTFKYNANKANVTFLDKERIEGNVNLAQISLFNKNFQYLSASRLAPQESYPRNDYEVVRNQQISLEKGKGELVAHFLHHFHTRAVDENLCNKNVKSKNLLAQTTAWEREISENINVKVEDIGRGYEIKYNFDVENGGFPTQDFRPENVGFGVTYTLPIITAILAAQKYSLIIIENPEAHLHPSGQSKLAELMALAAQTGIQIIVETHSDHIINGALVAMKKQQIAAENIKIFYFDRDESQHAVETTEIEVLKNGRLKNVPSGFFDQFGKDLKILMSTKI